MSSDQNPGWFDFTGIMIMISDYKDPSKEISIMACHKDFGRCSTKAISYVLILLAQIK